MEGAKFFQKWKNPSNRIWVKRHKCAAAQGRSRNSSGNIIKEVIGKCQASWRVLLKKTEARSLFEGAGVQFPEVSIQGGLIRSIFDAGFPVKIWAVEVEMAMDKRECVQRKLDMYKA